jgi:hypothetical protein
LVSEAYAGIKGRLRINELVDTLSTLTLRGGGVDIRIVAELIGDTPEVCLRLYCHTNEQAIR